MLDRIPILVIGGLTAGVVFTTSVLLYYNTRGKHDVDSNLISIDRTNYLELMESLVTTKKEVESAMRKLITNVDENDGVVSNDALYKSLKCSLNILRKFTTNIELSMSDTEEFETPPSGSLNIVTGGYEINNLHLSNPEWIYLNDGYHTQNYQEIWKIYRNKNINLDYYISCATEYAQTPIVVRKVRTKMLNLQDDVDYLIKVIALRGAFKQLLDNLSNFHWFVDTLKCCFIQILEIANKPTTQFDVAFEDFLSYAMDAKNSDRIEEELSNENIQQINAYDIVVDFMILDSLSDLNCLPSAILSVTKSRFISRSLKENAFCTLVWSYIQSKVKKLKYPNGFLAKYYNLCHTISPVLAWGFLGDNGSLNEACNSFKDIFMKFTTKLFDENRMIYENRFDLADCILKSAKKSYRNLMKQFKPLKD